MLVCLEEVDIDGRSFGLGFSVIGLRNPPLPFLNHFLLRSEDLINYPLLLQEPNSNQPLPFHEPFTDQRFSNFLPKVAILIKRPGFQSLGRDSPSPRELRRICPGLFDQEPDHGHGHNLDGVGNPYPKIAVVKTLPCGPLLRGALTFAPCSTIR